MGKYAWGDPKITIHDKPVRVRNVEFEGASAKEMKIYDDIPRMSISLFAARKSIEKWVEALYKMDASLARAFGRFGLYTAGIRFRSKVPKRHSRTRKRQRPTRLKRRRQRQTSNKIKR